MSRIIPVTGTEAQRQAAATAIQPGELHSTNDQFRLFLENRFIGPLWHGTLATEAVMLGLLFTASRGCWPGDMCYRSDTGTMHLCKSRNGQDSSDWVVLVPNISSVLAAGDVMAFKGTLDCSGSPDYPAADAGAVYKVSVAGRVGGASGPAVQAGDTLYCTHDGSAAGDHAAVGAYWVIAQVNIDGAVVGPASATSARIAVFDGGTGRLIADGGVAIADLAPKGAVTASGLTMGEGYLLGRWDTGTGQVQQVTVGANLILSEAGVLSASIGGSSSGLDMRAFWVLGGH